MARYSNKKPAIAAFIADAGQHIARAAETFATKTDSECAAVALESTKFVTQWAESTTEADRREIFARAFYLQNRAGSCFNAKLRRAFTAYAMALHTFSVAVDYTRAMEYANDARRAI